MNAINDISVSSISGSLAMIDFPSLDDLPFADDDLDKSTNSVFSRVRSVVGAYLPGASKPSCELSALDYSDQVERALNKSRNLRDHCRRSISIGNVAPTLPPFPAQEKKKKKIPLVARSKSESADGGPHRKRPSRSANRSAGSALSTMRRSKTLADTTKSATKSKAERSRSPGIRRRGSSRSSLLGASLEDLNKSTTTSRGARRERTRSSIKMLKTRSERSLTPAGENAADRRRRKKSTRQQELPNLRDASDTFNQSFDILDLVSNGGDSKTSITDSFASLESAHVNDERRRRRKSTRQQEPKSLATLDSLESLNQSLDVFDLASKGGNSKTSIADSFASLDSRHSSKRNNKSEKTESTKAEWSSDSCLSIDSHPSLSESSEETWACTCGSAMKNKMNFCGICGNRKYWTCSGCNFGENLNSWGFCGMCGIKHE